MQMNIWRIMKKCGKCDFLGVNISKKYNCFQDHIYLINVMCRYSQLKKQLKYEIIAGSHVVSGHFVLKILQIVNFLILVVRDFKITSNIENTTLIWNHCWFICCVPTHSDTLGLFLIGKLYNWKYCSWNWSFIWHWVICSSITYDLL